MADKVPVTVRTRKFLRNPLLARRQMVSSSYSNVHALASVTTHTGLRDDDQADGEIRLRPMSSACE